MNIFLFTLAGACLLAYLAEQRGNTTLDGVHRLNSTYVNLLIVFLVIISGFRYMNYFLNDEYNYRVYIDALYGMPFRPKFGFSSEWLYYIFSWICANVFRSNQLFIFTAAALTNVSFILYIKKYACDFTFAVFMYVAGGAYFSSMNIVRQFAAIAILVWCLEMASRRKFFQYVFWVVIAAGIHASSWLMLPLYFLFRKKKVDASVFLIVLCTFVGFIAFVPIINNLLSSGSVYDHYLEDLLSNGYGVKLIRILAWLVPYGIFLFLYGQSDNREKVTPQIFFCTILSASISIISYKYVYVARIGTIFSIPTLCAVVYIPRFFESHSQTLVKWMMIALFFIFGCYQMWGFSPYHNILFEDISGVL